MPNTLTAAVRLVAADMDGTFLATDKSVPPLNMRLLDVLAKAGVAFVPCTGRPVSAVPDVVLGHPATHFAIGANGAVVYDVRARQALHVVPIPKETVLSLYGRLRDCEVTFDVFADNKVFSERARYEAMSAFGIDEPNLAMLRRVRRPVDLTVPQVVQEASAVEKITCFWHTEADRDAIAQAVAEVGGLYCTKGHPKNFELQAAGVSKGVALAWLCAHVQIDAAHVVAFGDEANDLPMLRFAGDGVATQNAAAEVLATADHVTSSNDAAGVARYLLGSFAQR